MNDQNYVKTNSSERTPPQVSVIVPVYNVAKYLPQCLDSLLTQQNCDMEVVAVDDASTDGSWQILLEYAKRFPTLRIDRLPYNCGVAGARNRCMDMAQGDWIMFVDSDDFIDPECVPHLLSIAKDKQPDLIDFGVRTVDESGQVVDEKYRTHAAESWDLSVPEQRRAGLSAAVPCGLIWNKVFRHDLIKNLRFDQKCSPTEDTVFVLQAFCHTQTWERISNVFYNYRQRLGSAVYTLSKRRVLSMTVAFPAIENSFMDADFRFQVKDLCKKIVMQTASTTCYLIRKLPKEDRAECWQSFYDNFKPALCDPRLFTASQRLLNRAIFIFKWQPITLLRIWGVRVLIRATFEHMGVIKKRVTLK